MISPTTFNQVGRAVVGILLRHEETKNQYLAIDSFNITQNQLVEMVQKKSGSKLTMNHVASDDLDRSAMEKLAKRDPTGVFDLMKVFSFKDGAAHGLPAKDSANEFLGLPKEDLGNILSNC